MGNVIVQASPQILVNIVTPTCNALSLQFQYWASLK